MITISSSLLTDTDQTDLPPLGVSVDEIDDVVARVLDQATADEALKTARFGSTI